MMNFGLDGVMAALQFVGQRIAITMTTVSGEKGDQELDLQYKEVVENNLKWVHRMCNQHVLSATGDRLARIWGIRPTVTYAGLAIELKPLLEAFEDDLRKLRFYRYPQHKAMEFLLIPGTWAATLSAFPSIRPEIEAGVDCYALEHHPASVFYMMRVAEIGMRALARERLSVLSQIPARMGRMGNIIDKMNPRRYKRLLPDVSRPHKGCGSGILYGGHRSIARVQEAGTDHAHAR